MQQDYSLLRRFINGEVPDCRSLDIYENIKKDREDIKVYIDTLKEVLDLSYDFEFLTIEADRLNTNRRALRGLYDCFASMLGETIENACENPVISKPSQFFEYCPYPREGLVCYSRRQPDSIAIRKYSLNEWSTRLEVTPYYQIYCTTLEDY